MTKPTAREIENAVRRQEIAARFQREYDEAKAQAEAAFGPGWEPLCRHHLVDKDEEERHRSEGGTLTLAATVYTAWRGDERRHFVVEGGVPREVAGVEEGFGAMYREPHPTRGFEHRGRWIPYQRYSLCWSGYETYTPKTAEQLAEMRERREAKATERQAESSPLFADAIRSGELKLGKKPRVR